MTIAELITELQKHDPSLAVMVEGYEGGYGRFDKDALAVMKLTDEHGGTAMEALVIKREGPDFHDLFGCFDEA